MTQGLGPAADERTGRLGGLVLAAGAGSRRGQPKALAADERGDWLPRATAVLRAAGCDPVVVVLGAAPEAAALLGDGSRVVVAADWAEGQGASLRAGLEALGATDAEVALVTLVDLPDLTGAVAARVAGCADGPAALARATFGGRPGHPVLLGRDHWPGVLALAAGDAGARPYLAAHPPRPVECGDLASGQDVDGPPTS
ncbi:NTP transferase domain-containing protein [Nocardioides sp. GY 10127]|uniref:nucleotidyltransferase family protein n=1 Tax=Nocardioides sp. GY 10127 TaxID=2569762 RepID=UPI0010A80D36|nr:NTP transferase domain-containing protein [Nocardioides sp. GY 10127]TIC81948.1 nucleotidyltransferase family protein [Nocardioides sp. GY 10127]